MGVILKTVNMTTKSKKGSKQKVEQPDAKKAKKVPVKAVEPDSSSDDSDSEEEVVKTKKVVPVKKKVPAKKESSDDSSSESEDDEAPKKTPKQVSGSAKMNGKVNG